MLLLLLLLAAGAAAIAAVGAAVAVADAAAAAPGNRLLFRVLPRDSVSFRELAVRIHSHRLVPSFTPCQRGGQKRVDEHAKF